MNNITIIIPTYTNASGFINLIKNLKSFPCPKIIIDNLPDEEKKEICTDKNITYLPQLKNLGFSKAINLAVSQTKTKWALILNDDVRLDDPKKLKNLLAFAESHNYSAVSPLLKKNSGTIENIGYRVLPIGRVELNFDPHKTDQNFIDGLTAACLLMQTKDFRDIGGFDEKLFAYLEDVDLFLRMKKTGLTFAVNTDVEIIHDQSATSSQMGSFKQRQDLKNWFIIIFKNWNPLTLIKYLPLILIERLRNLSGLIKNLNK